MSTINPNYGCATLGEWGSVARCNYLKGAYMEVGFLHPGYQDIIDDFEDETQLRAAINAGLLTLVGGRGFKAELPDPSAIESDSADAFSTEQTLDGWSWALAMMDANISAANDNFWESANVYAFDGILLKSAMNEKVRVVEAPITVKMAPSNAPLAPRERRRYNGTATFSTIPDYFGVEFDAPEGIFQPSRATV